MAQQEDILLIDKFKEWLKSEVSVRGMKTSDIPDLPKEPILRFLGSHENTVDADE